MGRARGCGSAPAGPRAEVAEGARASLAEGRSRAGWWPPFFGAARSPSLWRTGSGCCVARDRRLRALGERSELSLRTAGVHRTPPISRTRQTLQRCTDSGSLFLGGLRALLLRGVTGSVKLQFDPQRAPGELVRAARASSIRRSVRAELLLL